MVHRSPALATHLGETYPRCTERRRQGPHHGRHAPLSKGPPGAGGQPRVSARVTAPALARVEPLAVLPGTLATTLSPRPRDVYPACGAPAHCPSTAADRRAPAPRRGVLRQRV